MSDEAQDVKKDDEKDGEAVSLDKMVRNHALASAGIGLLPFPLLDLAGVTGVQMLMLSKISKAYGVPFSQELGKHLIGSLTGGGVSFPAGRGLASLAKCIPFVGAIAGVLAMPAASFASTYALSRVFVKHFESGGDFLSFKPDQMRGYYGRMYKKGEKAAAEAM